MRLGTSGGISEHPYFFQGKLRRPRAVALALRTLSRVVAVRFHIPAAMLEKILRLSDPVVTCGGGTLRFEGFSGCCGAYARVDIDPDAYDAVLAGHGTTNVDFNAEMLAALGQIRDSDAVSLAVGEDEVSLLRGSEQVVEKKVALPQRWVRGFAEVQCFLARMECLHELGQVEAQRFVRGLPASAQPATRYRLAPMGRGVKPMPATGNSRGGVNLAGFNRVRLLEPLVPAMQGLRIYSTPRGDATAWEVSLGPLRFVLALSAETWRGFSGEGQVLAGLAQPPDEVMLDLARSSLHWQAAIQARQAATQWACGLGEAKAILQTLATQGLVGFDGAAAAYFHRELPFRPERTEKLNPRLKGARKILEKDGVRWISRTPGAREARVAGTGVEHVVREIAGRWSCTCPWFAKHQGERGMCKHILAAQIYLASEKDDR